MLLRKDENMAYEHYDKVHARYSHTQAVKGGTKRASTARRDRWGRMLPKDDTVSLAEPQKHGKAGGDALLKKYGKDYFKQLRMKQNGKAIH
jgi:hypothetical protein